MQIYRTIDQDNRGVSNLKTNVKLNGKATMGALSPVSPEIISNQSYEFEVFSSQNVRKIEEQKGKKQQKDSNE